MVNLKPNLKGGQKIRRFHKNKNKDFVAKFIRINCVAWNYNNNCRSLKIPKQMLLHEKFLLESGEVYQIFKKNSAFDALLSLSVFVLISELMLAML
jgi:hypothetical protein